MLDNAGGNIVSRNITSLSSTVSLLSGGVRCGVCAADVPRARGQTDGCGESWQRAYRQLNLVNFKVSTYFTSLAQFIS